LLFVLFSLLFVCKCVLPPGDNPIAVNKYTISNFYTNNFWKTKRSNTIPNWVTLLLNYTLFLICISVTTILHIMLIYGKNSIFKSHQRNILNLS
jgi:hypothetical protein